MAEVIPHWLTKQAELKPNKVALEFMDGTVYTFRELKKSSQETARKLAGFNVKAGSHVAVLSNNHKNMVAVIHALSYLGATVVLLNTRLAQPELQYQVDDAEVELLITDEVFREKGKELTVSGCYTMDEIARSPEKEAELKTEIHLDDRFTIIYTSGTTGFPKGVVHTYGNHWWNATASLLNLGLKENDKWLIALPLFHVSGLSTMLKSVIYGMPLLLMEKFDAELAHKAIMEKEVTIMSVVTVMVQRLLKKLQEKETYPSTFRCALLGGGPAPKPMLEEAKAKRVPVFQSYGMTETASQIVTLSPADALEKLGSAGKVLTAAQLRIHDPDVTGVGEITVKGPIVTSGYYKRKEANEKSFQDGWLFTGDLGYLDKEGFLYVIDRRKDLIISGGENIYPSEVESVLLAYDGVQEAAVIGTEDETWGQVPVAFVVTEAGLTAEEILEHAKERLAKYKLPKEIRFLDALPRNASNKIVKNRLKP